MKIKAKDPLSIKTPPSQLAFTYVSHLADPDTGIKMYLLNPLVIRLRQEQVLLAYPFHYLSGFCCYCPDKPVYERQIRGGQDCSLNVADDKQDFKASAHCLHFSDVWYSVSALSEPFIIHEAFLQVYIEKHFKNGLSAWFALTHDEDFSLNPQNTYQYDDNETIVISYITDSPNQKAITIPISKTRLLTPQPMIAAELSRVPVQIANGANDFLVLPKNIIDPEGDVCDVAGVSYQAFAKQPDRCKVPKNTCLKNQPLDFWEVDNEKRASGVKGDFLLRNFGIPYKDPVITDPETKEHWLALEYHELHHTVIFIEVNADEINILTVGKHAQISKITSTTVNKNIYVLASILNSGLMAAKFTIQAVKCAFGVPDSSKENITIPPQMTQDVMITTKPGSPSLNEKFTCTVQVSSASYGVIAERAVAIHPRSRCICNFHCKCACMSDPLKCELMTEKDYQTAGFRGSLPVLTAKPPYQNWLVAHPFLAILALLLILLLIGFIKGIFGVAGFERIGYFGLDKFLYRPKPIKKYHDLPLKREEPVYDEEGYPIHPHTKKRVRVVGDKMLFLYNLLFCFFCPCLLCRKCCVKMEKLSKVSDDDHGDTKKGERKEEIRMHFKNRKRESGEESTDEDAEVFPSPRSGGKDKPSKPPVKSSGDKYSEKSSTPPKTEPKSINKGKRMIAVKTKTDGKVEAGEQAKDSKQAKGKVKAK